MARYNHFSEFKYEQIPFIDIPVGQKFRKDIRNGKKVRRDIVCIKISEWDYKEVKSGQKYQYLWPTKEIIVSSYSALAN